MIDAAIGRPGCSVTPRPVATAVVTRLGSVERAELDEPCPIVEAVGQVRRQTHGQPRLPDSAGPGQGQHRCAVEEASCGSDLRLAADERRQLAGQVAARRLDGAQLGELSR